MPDTRSRLIRCFTIVFPELPEGRIPEATQDSVADWDSVAGITLVNVIEEEFAVAIDINVLPELDSFSRILEFVERLLAAEHPSDGPDQAAIEESRKFRF